MHNAPSDLFLRISFGKYLLSGFQIEEKQLGPIEVVHGLIKVEIVLKGSLDSI